MNKILVGSMVALLCFANIQDTLGTRGRAVAGRTLSRSNSSTSINNSGTLPGSTNLPSKAADDSVVTRSNAGKMTLKNASASPQLLATTLEPYCKLIARKKNPVTDQKISSDEAKLLRPWVDFLKVASDVSKSAKKLTALQKKWNNASISSGVFTKVAMPYIVTALSSVISMNPNAEMAADIAQSVVANDKALQ